MSDLRCRVRFPQTEKDENVEPSAQSCDGDACDRLSDGGGRARGESGGREIRRADFLGTCNACHKSPRGLLKTVSASSLSGFLRQHYTTSSDMANVLAGFLVSNGAADQRFQAKDQPKQKDGAKDAAKDAKQEAATRPAAAQQPDHRQRLPRPGETPDVMRPDHGPAQAAIDAKQGAKQKQGKKGRPEEPPKAAEEAAKAEPSATEAPKSETAKETTKGDDSAKPEPARARRPRSTRRRIGQRADRDAAGSGTTRDAGA